MIKSCSARRKKATRRSQRWWMRHATSPWSIGDICESSRLFANVRWRCLLWWKYSRNCMRSDGA